MAPQFIRCRTCGKYLVIQNAIDERYCSEACQAAYESCGTCGRFFLSGSGHAESYCSKDCATVYTVTRSFGPQPVSSLVEE